MQTHIWIICKMNIIFLLSVYSQNINKIHLHILHYFKSSAFYTLELCRSITYSVSHIIYFFLLLRIWFNSRKYIFHVDGTRKTRRKAKINKKQTNENIIHQYLFLVRKYTYIHTYLFIIYRHGILDKARFWKMCNDVSK